MDGKGESEFSGIKHASIERIIRGQEAIARRILPFDASIALTDMHAADGFGSKAIQLDLLRGGESKATAVQIVECALRLRRAGYHAVEVYLCEKNNSRRTLLAARFRDVPGLRILKDHSELPSFRPFIWALILNDPNGPGDHGDDTLQRIAKECRRADFLIVVNEGACERILGVRQPSANPKAVRWSRDPASIAAQHARIAWRLKPDEWGRRLGRRSVMVARSLYGCRGMKGRILLVSNAPARNAGFEISTVDGSGRQTPTASAEPAPRHPIRRRSVDRSTATQRWLL